MSISAALGWLLTLATGPVHALGLGEIVEQSSLGQPLRFAITVLANADDLASDELAPECFRLVPSESARSGELPQITFGRATLERNAAGARVIVSSNAVAHEPALSFTVEAGCRLRLRHEYTVLLDPPVIREPTAEAQSEPSVPPLRAAATPRRPGLAPSAAAGSSSPRTGTRPRPSTRAEGAGRANASGAGKRAARAEIAAPGANLERPSLSVSRSAQDQLDEHSGMTEVARGKSDEEIRREVEAETVVLQRRIAELSATLERMEAELRDATAAREAAERTARASSPPPAGPDPWLVSLLLALTVAALAVILLRARRAARLTMPAFADPEAPPSEEVPSAPATRAGIAPAMPRRPPSTVPALPSSSAQDAARFDEEDSFYEDLLRYAEQTATYSVLEREHPKVVASVIRDWGKPRVIAYLRELLVAPRQGSRTFSREAVSDLTFLQSLAMEHAGYASEESPWQVEIDHRRQRRA